jgi:L-aminopeptidase/D-esterase-like protein
MITKAADRSSSSLPPTRRCCHTNLSASPGASASDSDGWVVSRAIHQGDLFLAFSTANAGAAKPDGTPSLVMLPNDRIDPLFQATIEATEEAVVNAMLVAQTMTGADGIRAFGLPGNRVVEVLKKYTRMK